MADDYGRFQSNLKYSLGSRYASSGYMNMHIYYIYKYVHTYTDIYIYIYTTLCTSNMAHFSKSPGAKVQSRSNAQADTVQLSKFRCTPLGIFGISSPTLGNRGILRHL